MRTPYGTSRPGSLSATPRSPKCRSPRSPAAARAATLPPGCWSADFSTRTPPPHVLAIADWQQGPFVGQVHGDHHVHQNPQPASQVASVPGQDSLFSTMPEGVDERGRAGLGPRQRGASHVFTTVGNPEPLTCGVTRRGSAPARSDVPRPRPTGGQFLGPDGAPAAKAQPRSSRSR